jgi:hypothetical protein
MEHKMSSSTHDFQYHTLQEEGKPNTHTKQPGALTHHEEKHIHGAKGELHDHCEKVKQELATIGITDKHESIVVVALDISGSMQHPDQNEFYYNPDEKGNILDKIRLGQIQRFLLKALSMAVEITPGNHQVIIFPFGERAYPPVTIDEHDLEEAAEKILASLMLFRKSDSAELESDKNIVLASLMAESQLDFNHDDYDQPTRDYLRQLKTLQAYDQDVIDNAMKNITTFVLHNLDGNTNYHAPVEAILKYFKLNGTKDRPISQYDNPPITVKFLTDGEGRMKKLDTLNIFQQTAYNPIFFHLIGLQGQNKNLTFSQLTQIKIQHEDLPNISTTIVKNPDDLTIQEIFTGYRHWLIEAFEHGMLKHNPGVNLNMNDPDDHQEIMAAQAHGHASSHAIIQGQHPPLAQAPGGPTHNPPPLNPYINQRPALMMHGQFGNQATVQFQQRQLAEAQQRQEEADECCGGCTIM